MSLRAQIIILVVLILALAVVLNAVRKKSMRLKYALPWFGCLIVLLIVSAIPNGLVGLSNLLGIYSPVNMVFFLGFLFSLAIIFVLTLVVSRLAERIRKLTQAMALMEKRLMQEQKEGNKL